MPGTGWANTDELIWAVKRRIARQKRKLMQASKKEKDRIEALLESDQALLE